MGREDASRKGSVEIILEKIGKNLQISTPIIGVIFLVIGILMTYQNITITIASESYSGGIVALLAGLILIGVNLATLKPGRSIYNIPIIIVFSIILFLGYWYLFNDKIATKPEVMKYDIFKDLLIIILTTASVMIALIGYLAYRLLEKDVEKRVDELTNEVYQRSIAHILCGVGFACWCNYKSSKEFHQLKNALLFTRRAYQDHAIKLNEKNIINKEVILLIKNNLAYYVAEIYRLDKDEDVKEILKNTREANRELAIKYANEINKNKSRFLEHFNEWTDTYKFIHQHCVEKSDKK